MKENTEVALVTVALGGAALFAYLFAKKQIQAASNFVAKPIASAILAVTLPGDIRLNGVVRIPNGQILALKDLAFEKDLRFSWSGIRYQIVSRTDEYYVAQKV